ncbi:TIGR03751 family conjugal transfer lipoprotein [Yersinia proxima]
MNRMLKILAIAFTAVLLSGCSSSKEKLLPAGDSTMLDLWQHKATSQRTVTEARSTLKRQLTKQNDEANPLINDGYSRTTKNEIQQLFPRLPNPDMVIYIYPHISGSESVPVPGYSSVFPFYSRVQYALPGERTEAL